MTIILIAMIMIANLCGSLCHRLQYGTGCSLGSGTGGYRLISVACTQRHRHTNTQPFNGPLSGTTRVSRYQKGKTNLDFTEARDSEWQWHQLGHMQVCTSLQTDNHASTPPLSCLQAGCPSILAPSAINLPRSAA